MAKNKPEIPTDLLNFLDRLPNDLQEKMTPKVRNQFFLWDEILKRDITLYPRHILPLIQEIFHRTYPADIKIEAVSTEYSVSRISLQNGKRLSAIHSDLLLKVGEKDYYHFECQIEEDETMAIRMLEYDLHAGLAHGAGQPASANAPFHLSLPNSAVLYLSHSKRTPDFLACKLHFQDGSSHLFRVPVLKVQAYTTEMVAERGLYLLIPFLPIRVRKYLKRKNGSAIAKNKLTILIQKCMIVLEDGMASGRLTGNERSDLTEFLFAACSSIFAGEPDFLEEVHDMMEPAIKLRREIYAEQHAEIMQQQLEIAQQKLEITQQQLEIEQQKAEIEQQQAEIEQRQSKIEQQQSEIQQQQVEIEQQHSKITYLTQQIENTQSVVKERDHLLETQNQQMKQLKARTLQFESTIRNFILDKQRQNCSPTEILDSLRTIFTLDEPTAKEKLQLYCETPQS